MTRDQLLDLLRSADLALLLPEVAALQKVPQSPEYHAEGNAFVHTLLSLESLPKDTTERLVWAVALHDIGKADTTRWLDEQWRAPGHDRCSAEMVPKVLERFDRYDLIQDVVWLVRHHHFAGNWQPKSTHVLTPRQRRFCEHPLFDLLVDLCRADAAGSRGKSTKLELLERVLGARNTIQRRPLK